MNKNTIYLVIFTVLCVLAGALIGVTVVRKACPPGPYMEMPRFAERAEHFMGHGPLPGGPPVGRMPGDGLFEMVSERLELNKEQQAKVKAILEKTRQDIEEVGRSVRNAIIEIRDVSNSQIMEVLTPAQQEKFKAMIESMERRFGAHEPPPQAPHN
jgi:Spy/CpxP family protein refolding chaperone